MGAGRAMSGCGYCGEDVGKQHRAPCQLQGLVKGSLSRSGALVRYCGHDAMFVADVYVIGECGHEVVAILANGDVGQNRFLIRPATDEATHHLRDFPTAGMWKPQRGVFVVPAEQVEVLR